MTDALIKKGGLYIDIHRGESPCEREGRDGVIHPQAKEWPRSPANYEQ